MNKNVESKGSPIGTTHEFQTAGGETPAAAVTDVPTRATERSAGATELSEKDIRRLAEGALDAACIQIQDALGVTTGDVAALVFSGRQNDEIVEAFSMYIRTELNYRSAAQSREADD